MKITLNCNDSGSTNDIYTQGEVNYQHFPGHFTTYEDMCDDTRHVKKYFCNASDQPDYDLTMCPSGYKCSSGRCKRKGGGGGYTPPGPCNGQGQACTIGVGACATNGTWVCNGTGLVCNAPSVCGCATPVCGLSACGCADSDGDGFSDAWENQDYIDINCNGVYDANVDFHFPHADFTLINHTGTGTGVLGLAPTNTSSPVEPADVEITIVSNGSTGVATFNYSINGSIPVGPMATNRSIDLHGNVRLYFSNGNPEPSFVAGDNYAFSSGVDAKIADKDTPNIYVQYDYMGWAAPGAACVTDADCVALGNPNEVCHEGFCNHDHQPINPTFQNVVNAFAAHNVTLYIDPIHNEIPHSQVITFQLASDPGVANCAGAVPGALGSYAVNFHDVKNRTTYGGPFEARRKNVFCYAVFGHHNTFDTDVHSGACPQDRASPPSNAVIGA